LKLLAEAHEECVDAEVLAEAIDPAVEKIRAKVSFQLLKTLKQAAPAMLEERREANAGFMQRNFERWRGAFDLFEMLIEMATELGQEHDKEVRPAAIRDQDFRFDAIAHLQP